jgi:hypothetical protein
MRWVFAWCVKGRSMPLLVVRVGATNGPLGELLSSRQPARKEPRSKPLWSSGSSSFFELLWFCISVRKGKKKKKKKKIPL